jgi:hypothetical protein
MVPGRPMVAWAALKPSGVSLSVSQRELQELEGWQQSYLVHCFFFKSGCSSIFRCLVSQQFPEGLCRLEDSLAACRCHRMQVWKEQTEHRMKIILRKNIPHPRSVSAPCPCCVVSLRLTTFTITKLKIRVMKVLSNHFRA